MSIDLSSVRLRRAMLRGLLVLTACGGAQGQAADQSVGFQASWGPAVGSQLPLLEARDQAGQPRTLDGLTGNQGLLLFLNRSADW